MTGIGSDWLQEPGIDDVGPHAWASSEEPWMLQRDCNQIVQHLESSQVRASTDLDGKLTRHSAISYQEMLTESEDAHPAACRFIESTSSGILIWED